MDQSTNEFGQHVGAPLAGWSGRQRPQRKVIEGRFCRLEPLSSIRHADDLYSAYSLAADGRDWTYMGMGPFPTSASFTEYIVKAVASEDPLHFSVLEPASGRAMGTMALMRIDTGHGVIEVGTVMFSPALQRTPASTEAQYLLMRYVFEELAYRRYEWKCDSLNVPSRHTAVRLGFRFDGIFRQAMVYKGRNRDTAWFSIIDSEWPNLRAAFEEWLRPENFNAHGGQYRSLAAIRHPPSAIRHPPSAARRSEGKRLRV